MDNKQFNLQWQWQQYLKRSGVSEDMMPPIQRQEMKRAFYGACGQMLIMLRDELTQLSDDGGANTLQDMLNQVGNFWEQETNKK